MTKHNITGDCDISHIHTVQLTLTSLSSMFKVFIVKSTPIVLPCFSVYVPDLKRCTQRTFSQRRRPLSEQFWTSSRTLRLGRLCKPCSLNLQSNYRQKMLTGRKTSSSRTSRWVGVIHKEVGSTGEYIRVAPLPSPRLSAPRRVRRQR